jgi:hypothetical protein
MNLLDEDMLPIDIVTGDCKATCPSSDTVTDWQILLDTSITVTYLNTVSHTLSHSHLHSAQSLYPHSSVISYHPFLTVLSLHT